MLLHVIISKNGEEIDAEYFFTCIISHNNNKHIYRASRYPQSAFITYIKKSMLF